LARLQREDHVDAQVIESVLKQIDMKSGDLPIEV
jgi:hypothetical protein